MPLQRIVTGVVAMAIALAALWVGGPVFVIAVTCIAVLALKEFLDLAELSGSAVNGGLVMAAGALFPFLAYRYAYVGLLAAISGGCLVLWLWKVATHPRVGLRSVALSLLALAYIPLPLSYLVLSLSIAEGRLLVLFIFVATWIADTAAYGIGSIIGKHQLAPRLSPNKTIEGTLGAVAVNMLVFGALVRWPATFDLRARLVFAAVVTVAAVVGDLSESALKREVEVKDSGRLFPGHGGVLDRIDSLLFASVTAFFLVKVVGF